MSLYPTLEELADVNIDYFMEDRESVMFRRTNGKIGVCKDLCVQVCPGIMHHLFS